LTEPKARIRLFVLTFISVFILLAIGDRSQASSQAQKAFTILPETPREREYLDKVWETPTKFKVSSLEELESARGLAYIFLQQYSSVKVSVFAENVIQTYDPEYGQFGYQITFTREDLDNYISIQCLTPKPTKASEEYDYSMQAELNAHILAHYITIGTIWPKFIKK